MPVAEAGIWTIDQVTGKLTAVWVNIDGSTVPVSCAYHIADNTFVLVGDIDGFTSQYPNWVPVVRPLADFFFGCLTCFFFRTFSSFNWTILRYDHP